LDVSGELTGNFDVEQVSRVLSNLLGNAVQHGRHTGITFAASGEPDRVVLAVTNGGHVLTDAELLTIFEPTVRGGEARASETSLGLGLYIARQIARAHGGEIHAVSSARDGTTFTAVLPKSETAPGR
jgi:signal transduction histidine kinase